MAEETVSSHRRASHRTRCRALPRDGVTQENVDSDRKAVRVLFGLIFDVVESLQGRFQVIITDHTDFAVDVGFQAALRGRWRGGLKPVSEDSPRVS